MDRCTPGESGPVRNVAGATRKGIPIVTDLSAFAELLSLDHGLCVLSTLRRDGSVQASVVNAGVMPHPLTSVHVVALVAVGGARKLHNLRADLRATIVAPTPTPRLASAEAGDVFG